MRPLLGLALLVSAACRDFPTGETFSDPRLFPVAMRVIVEGLDAPTYLGAPPGDPRLFVTEQSGRIRIVRSDTLVSKPFLDLTDEVLSGGEQGLLGLAFSPSFGTDGRFFVHYTGPDGSTRLVSYVAPGAGDEADPASAELLLTLEQPYANHNGGQLDFGPDGMLYVGLGDGGGAGDPDANGQDRGTLLGSILRLDVSAPGAYAVPPDNPFVDSAGMRPEIWHYGLRNPWRFSFSETYDLLVVGDVGQNAWEEVDAVPTSERGLNFGWPIMEGAVCYGPPGCNSEGLRLPVAVYHHDEGCSVTGGYVYEGSAIPSLQGRYVYSDYCSGWLRTFLLAPDGQASDPVQLLLTPPGAVTSLGRDSAGELYVLTADGTVRRITPLG